MSRSADHVERSWLITVRWTTLAACVGALLFGEVALNASVWGWLSTAAVLGMAASNAWLRSAARRGGTLEWATGLLVSADVVVLAACLLVSGGVLNPAGIFFLVEIVVAALALSRTWLWIVTALSVAGYGVQLLAPASELAAAQTMHPQIGQHVRGMWWAFALTALMISVLVARLANAIERRDRKLAQLRAEADRHARVLALASLAAGAAHELSTPLGTIAVAAGELARSARVLPGAETLVADVELIRAELGRARNILTNFSGRADHTSRHTETMTIGNVIDCATRRLPVSLAKAPITISGDTSVVVKWRVDLAARALTNVLANAVRASGASDVDVSIESRDPQTITLSVVDRGAGMTPEILARAGEPFFTTQTPGDGMGLGLFVARSTAEQMGGSMIVRSIAGKGTTVLFELPRIEQASGRSI